MLGGVLGVKSEFSHGEFENDEEICMQVPEGFENFYPVDMLSLLLKK